MAHRINVVALTAVLVVVIALAPGTHLHAQLPLDELRALAEQGDADEQFNLGLRYADGLAHVSPSAPRLGA